MTEATATRWTLRLEIKTAAGEVQSRELTSFSRPARAASPQEIGLTLAEAKKLLAKVQQGMVVLLHPAIEGTSDAVSAVFHQSTLVF